MAEWAFSFLRMRSNRARRIVLRGRRFALRKILMRKGMSRENAKTLAAEYQMARR